MSALFSPCRTWRYRLERRWADGPTAAFILLNPSTADETNDDPTIRRCIGFAKAWGMGGLVLGNIFALRSTDPKGLYSHSDPVGPENDEHLARIAQDAATIVCGWGSHGAFRNRGRAVLNVIREAGVMPMALKLTSAGHPGHPLYLRSDLQPFEVASPQPLQEAADAPVSVIKDGCPPDNAGAPAPRSAFDRDGEVKRG